ncbi:helix-turn-helix transcriptional regulator [Streptomyces sp. ID05-47C]|uniref:helix-turn-helix domain-containing protein n=1 Tax=Streptomyces sp. ID05-47C TaxID=3028665 RepID=UPI0029BB7823|nr:helix-turn-helix transcriptional regulator [Streptomyces sp. ID05-47C]MDX3570800.1 helix-turn-helix transcriptional regulator [Streptomyces sp. ID05-47C]
MSPEDLRRISAMRMAASSGEAREKRRELRLTLKEIAAAVGASPASVNRWERGESSPRGTSALRWADALGVEAKAT